VCHPERLQQLVGAPLSVLTPLLQHVHGRQPHVVHRGEMLEQVVELEDHADPPHLDGSGDQRIEPGNAAQNGRLPRARRAH
jgi:hypothetical protein